jgi:hypothetical protein
MLELYLPNSKGQLIRNPAKPLAVGVEPRIRFDDLRCRGDLFLKRWLDKNGITNPLPTKEKS